MSALFQLQASKGTWAAVQAGHPLNGEVAPRSTLHSAGPSLQVPRGEVGEEHCSSSKVEEVHCVLNKAIAGALVASSLSEVVPKCPGLDAHASEFGQIPKFDCFSPTSPVSS